MDDLQTPLKGTHNHTNMEQTDEKIETKIETPPMGFFMHVVVSALVAMGIIAIMNYKKSFGNSEKGGK